MMLVMDMLELGRFPLAFLLTNLPISSRAAELLICATTHLELLLAQKRDNLQALAPKTQIARFFPAVSSLLSSFAAA